MYETKKQHPVGSHMIFRVLKATEEKWLRELYGREYEEYCKRVNRCILWKRN